MGDGRGRSGNCGGEFDVSKDVGGGRRFIKLEIFILRFVFYM